MEIANQHIQLLTCQELGCKEYFNEEEPSIEHLDTTDYDQSEQRLLKIKKDILEFLSDKPDYIALNILKNLAKHVCTLISARQATTEIKSETQTINNITKNILDNDIEMTTINNSQTKSTNLQSDAEIDNICRQEYGKWATLVEQKVATINNILGNVDNSTVDSISLPSLEDICCTYKKLEPINEFNRTIHIGRENRSQTLSLYSSTGSLQDALKNIPEETDLFKIDLNDEISKIIPSVDQYKNERNLRKKELEKKVGDFLEKFKFHLSLLPLQKNSDSTPPTKNPKDMWLQKPVNKEDEYPKDDYAYSSSESSSNYYIIAGSQKGRMHWHSGAFRDDDFAIKYDKESQWNFLAVADGAGSRKFARKGSSIVCQSLSNYAINDILKANDDIFHDFVKKPNEGNKKRVKQELYQCLISNKAIDSTDQTKGWGAIYHAYRDICAEAKSKGRSPDDYATTLLFILAKKYEEGWFISSFMVGDGVISLYNESDDPGVLLLGHPDEGEYGGETRFITTTSLWTGKEASNQLLNRFNVQTINEFTALFLMTDGVSDPKFETSTHLNSKKIWQDFYNDLRYNVIRDLPINESSHALVQPWLDFYSTGNHDDRTLIVMYKGI